MPITSVEYTAAADDGIAFTHTEYTYDPLGRLDSVIVHERGDQPLGTPEVTDYFYDLLGNLDEVHLPNGVVSDYTYDELNRLTLLRQFKDGVDSEQPYVYESGVDTLLAEFDYDLAADGKRTGVTEKMLVDSVLEETRIDWLYDNAGRLTAEVYDADVSVDGDPLDFITQYKFDLVGNRLGKQTDQGATDTAIAAFLGDPDSLNSDVDIAYEYDLNDRLLTEAKDDLTVANEDRFTEYEYDATQQTAKTVYEGLDALGTKVEETAYGYNLQGRMSTVTIDSDGNGVPETQLKYEYNDDGIRVAQEKRVDDEGDGFEDETPERTEYLIDRLNPTGYAQVLEEWLDGALAKSYTLGLDVIAQALASGAVHFFLYDGHGSTRALVDPTGQPLSGQIYRYDAYGNPIGFDPATALTTLLYSGEQLGQLTGLQYLRARYYDLATGRFNRLDPFFGDPKAPQGLHKYLYAHANPPNFADPSGLFSMGDINVSMVIRATLMGLNVHGAIVNARNCAEHAVGAFQAFYAGDFWGGIGHGVLAILHFGFAYLSVLGLKAGLIKPPPMDLQGGLSAVVEVTGSG